MRHLLILMGLASVVLCGISERAEAGKCVALKKGAALYSHADKRATVGKATAPAIGYIEKKQGAWYVLRFEQVTETENGSSTLSAVFRATVRKKHVKKAECARPPSDAREPSDSLWLTWTNGRHAGWAVAAVELGSRSKHRGGSDVPMPCYDYRKLGLAFVICEEFDGIPG